MTDPNQAMRDIYLRIRAFWENAETVGPTLDLPIVCCLCRKELAGECKVPDFREFCPAYINTTELGREDFVVLAPYCQEA